MAKHSPGNWRYEHENGANPRIVTDAIDVGTGAPCVLADLTCAMRAVGDDWTAEMHANARLFAGSKLLLELLALALPYVEDALESPHFKPGVVKKHAAQIRAEIERHDA